ncbi:LOW QUALITY PROTEIN: anomalous homeobox protein [Apodemus sylvaticus]|uniref:LOW QUALITY PROTEIN: anomalous homeobox protein n=1 Tax=Apodemus sylvaticus TaxID=10129 RepID=UPI0022447E2D|nr:LOW QUALITY PROTEIN: anomalous homeobox protein [Apodemus sylvaticus]
MQDFLRLLKAHADASSPPPDLVTMAGKLCLDLEDNPVQVVQLVEAILDSKHRWALLKNIDVTLVCVQVLIQQEQHLLALQILEVCHVPGGSQDLVHLWNDIHYQLTMRRLGVTELSAAQRFRCRKRNPPPLTFCPEGPKNRNFLPEVRSCLQDFATGVSAYPKKAQLENLASETGLTTEQVYSWFANYRRRQKVLLQHVARAQEATSEDSQEKDHVPETVQLSGNHLESLTLSQCTVCFPEGNGPLQSPDTTQQSKGPKSLAESFSGNHMISQSLGLRSLYECERHPEWRGHHPASLTSMAPARGPGLCPLAAGSSNMDSSVNAPESSIAPLTLPSSKEVFHPVEQAGCRQNPNSGMDSEVAPLPMAAAAISDLSHAGCTEQQGSHPQSLYPEEDPGPRSGQVASSALSKNHHRSSLEVMPALPAMSAPLSTMELSQPLPFSQVQTADDQPSWDTFWGATMLLEFSECALGRTARVEMEQHTE